MNIKTNLKRVINFSGGRTSAMMTILLKPTFEDIVLFTDTKREHNKTYEFIDNFEKNEGIRVIRISDELGFKRFNKELPNIYTRLCTKELKIKTAKRWLKDNKIITFENYIGFRADEPERVRDRDQRFKKVFDKFPLYEWGITEVDVLKFWEKRPYNLSIPKILGNCECCFLKGKDALIKIIANNNTAADEWIEDEKRTGYKFIKGFSYSTLKDIALSQTKLFNLENLEAAYKCKCNSL